MSISKRSPQRGQIEFSTLVDSPIFVVQEKKIRRVGSTEEYSVDFRIVAATKSDIVDRVRDGAFLEDLYFRLRYLCIEVPSLRERPEDIEPLVTFFCKKYEEQTGHKRSFLVRAIRVLESHDWPGNIRELESYVFRILIECSSDVIDIKHLDLDSLHSAPKLAGMSIPDLEMRHERERRELLSSVIRRSTSMAQAAQRTRIPVTTLKSMAKRYGLQGARRAR